MHALERCAAEAVNAYALNNLRRARRDVRLPEPDPKVYEGMIVAEHIHATTIIEPSTCYDRQEAVQHAHHRQAMRAITP